MTTMNWGDLLKEAGDSGAYSPLPDGDYELELVEAQATVSQSGKTMFKVKSLVSGGPHNGRFVWDNLVVSQGNPNALGIFFAKMSALGLSEEYFKNNPTNAQVEQALVGRKYRATIGTRTWQGSQRNEVRKYFPAGGPATTASAAPAAAAPAPAPAPTPAPAPAPAAPAVDVDETASAPAAPF